MTTNYLELINRGARQYPERTAIVFQNDTLTFRQVDHLSSRLAHAMHAHNLGQGARVALLLNNGLYSVPLDFACVRAGINRVPLNARLSVTEHARMLRDTQCTAVIFGEDLSERAHALQQELPNVVFYGLGAALNGGIDLLATIEQYATTPPPIIVADDDVVLTLFTSGTTGTLKAVQHTQRSYAGICKNVLMNLIQVQPDDAMLHAASMIHASGVFVLPFWLFGAKTVIMSAFDPTEFLHLIEKEKITAVNMVPTMMQMLVEHPEFAQIDITSLRQVIYGASPMPLPVIKRAMQLWGKERFWQYYGQTECPLTIAVLRPEDHEEELLGACGKPSVDVKIKLVDEGGAEVPVGTPGEIAVKGPGLMQSYFNAPELNAEMFTADGWLLTRDVGVFDERGFLHLKDRTSDMIISGGYNVYPREVEDVLMLHPQVLECAVIGVKDAKWVEAVTAVVVLKEGADATAANIIEFVSQRLATYKKPRNVIFVDAIPKTAVGKLNRKALRDKYSV